MKKKKREGSVAGLMLERLAQHGFTCPRPEKITAREANFLGEGD